MMQCKETSNLIIEENKIIDIDKQVQKLNYL